MTPPVCHAGAGHDHGVDRGASGWLCDRCYAAYLRILHRAPVSLLQGGRVEWQREAMPIERMPVDAETGEGP